MSSQNGSNLKFTSEKSQLEVKKFSDINPHLRVNFENFYLNREPLNTQKIDYDFKPIDKSQIKLKKSNFNWQLNEFNY